MPRSVSHFSALASVWFETMKSRPARPRRRPGRSPPPRSRGGRLRPAEQRLGRDARPVGALAADELAFDDGDAQPALGQRAGAVLARRAAAEHDDVVVGHDGSTSETGVTPAWSFMSTLPTLASLVASLGTSVVLTAPPGSVSGERPSHVAGYRSTVHRRPDDLTHPGASEWTCAAGHGGFQIRSGGSCMDSSLSWRSLRIKPIGRSSFFARVAVPMIKQGAGFVGGTWMRSLDGRRTRSLILYEDEAAAHAAAEHAAQGPPPGAPTRFVAAEVFEVMAQA